MFDRKRPIWSSSLLHAVLIGGAVVFTLPYVWLVGTSWKLDKEVQSAEVHLLPQRPVPSPVSPYIDTRTFERIGKPDRLPAERWTDWTQKAFTSSVGDAVNAWLGQHPDAASLPHVREELVEGVFGRLVNVLSDHDWSLADKRVFSMILAKAITADMIQESFDQAYRCFAIGELRLQTQDYQVHNLTGDRPADEVWTVTSGPARLEARTEADRSVAVLHYDFNNGGRFELASTFTVPVDLADHAKGFKRIEMSFRSDQTWHDLRVLVEMAGRLYRSSEPRYLGIDRWWEAQFQLPGPDDQRLMPKRYILLKEIAAGPEYDHGPHALKVRVQLERSSRPEAYWAKGTENYRRAFDEVPFWRYFKTSTFLVAVNILGTLLSCSLAAYAFARLNWPGRDLCFVLVLATLMIPPQITMIPSFVIYKHLGWYNTLAPLWVPNLLAVNGFAIFLLRQAMKGIPKDLEEAAKIDGCSHLRIWWDIMLPLVKPTLAAISIFTFMFVWNDFMGPLIYVNDQRLYPLALGLFSFLIGRENQVTLIMAGSMIMTLPVILTFFFAQRYFIQGVAMSGMKN